MHTFVVIDSQIGLDCIAILVLDLLHRKKCDITTYYTQNLIFAQVSEHTLDYVHVKAGQMIWLSRCIDRMVVK